MLLRKDFHKSFPFKRSEKKPFVELGKKARDSKKNSFFFKLKIILNTSIDKKLDLTASQTFFVVVWP